jgi:glycosyltransferase involved in cell wall biosynthesis
MNHSVFLLSLTESGPMIHHAYGWTRALQKQIQPKGRKVKVMVRGNESKWWIIGKAIILTIRQKPRNLVIINGEYNPGLSILLMIARIAGVRTYLTWHDVTPHDYTLKSLMLWTMSMINSICANNVIVHNRSYRNAAVLNKKAVFTPLPNIKLPPKSSQKVVPISERENTIVFLGATHAYKGLDILLDIYLSQTASVDVKMPLLKIVGNVTAEAKKRISQINTQMTKIIVYEQSDDYQLMQTVSNARAVVMPYRHCSQSTVPQWTAAGSAALIVSVKVADAMNLRDADGIYICKANEDYQMVLTKTSHLRPFVLRGSDEFRVPIGI